MLLPGPSGWTPYQPSIRHRLGPSKVSAVPQRWGSGAPIGKTFPGFFVISVCSQELSSVVYKSVCCGVRLGSTSLSIVSPCQAPQPQTLCLQADEAVNTLSRTATSYSKCVITPSFRFPRLHDFVPRWKTRFSVFINTFFIASRTTFNSCSEAPPSHVTTRLVPRKRTR